MGPSRRVSVHWDRRRAGALRRFLGPGVMRSAFLLLVVGGLAILGLGLSESYFPKTILEGGASWQADRPKPSRPCRWMRSCSTFAGKAMPHVAV